MGSSQQFSLRWNNYLKHITCAFDTLRTDEDLVDVTLSCEGKRIRAHKMLLSACSTYFRDLFKVIFFVLKKKTKKFLIYLGCLTTGKDVKRFDFYFQLLALEFKCFFLNTLFLNFSQMQILKYRNQSFKSKNKNSKSKNANSKCKICTHAGMHQF